MTAPRNVDALMIGHVARDRLVVDGRAELATGGAVYYGSVALRRLGLRVAVATRLHPSDDASLDALRREGVAVYAAAAEESSGIENIYRSDDMERRITRPLGFAGAFAPEDIPDLPARVIMVVPIMAGEVDLPLLASLAERAPIALDVQGFVRVRQGRDLVYQPWEEIAEGLAHVTYLKVDLAEAQAITGLTDGSQAIERLAEYGPQEIVLTQSSGVTVLAQGREYWAPFAPRSLAGRTGRGDTCFATYVGWRLDHRPEEATRLAGAVTTLKQEVPGPWRGTLEEAWALARTWGVA